jgi:UPF0755 protein
LAIAVAVSIAAAAGISAGRWALEPLLAKAPESIFIVEPGTSLGSIARNLEARGLIRSAFAFNWLARYRDRAGDLQIGEYQLSAAMAPEEILERIATGRVATFPVSVPEGLTARQIAERMERAGLARAEDFQREITSAETAAAFGVEGDTLEGYLFPETYHLPHGLSAREVAKVMVDQFFTVWSEIEARAAEQDLSMKDVVTLASIVEKETAAQHERPLIAAVFRNRLRLGMRLETDPTVIYGIPDFDGNLRRRDLENRSNPYNTYVIPALPPGPIANPGGEALRAVVNPADSDYLFFVSRNDGTHKFSKSYAEHVRAVDRFQRRRNR